MVENVLVTGSNGQLGSEIREIAEGMSGWHFENSSSLDITNFDAVDSFVEKNNIQFLINCAAYTAVDKAEDDREAADLVNHLAVSNLAKICSNRGIKLIHISTDYVFNGTSSIAYATSDKTDPINYYGETKLLGENAILNSDVDALIIRTSWVYSEFGNNFVKTMLRLSAERDTLNVVEDQVGSPTYAADLALACVELINRHEEWENGVTIYHYSNIGETNWFEFASAIMELAGRNCEVKPIKSEDFKTRAKRPNFSLLDKTDIIEDFGLTIPEWKESLKVCLSRF